MARHKGKMSVKAVPSLFQAVGPGLLRHNIRTHPRPIESLRPARLSRWVL